MRTLASRLLLGALLVVAAGLVLGFESEGGGAAPTHLSYTDAKALLTGAGMRHLHGGRRTSWQQLQATPLPLRRCPSWLYGSSATGGHVNAWVCRNHTDAVAAMEFVIKGAQLGGPNLRSSTNANLVLIVLARTSGAAARLTKAVGGA